MTVTWVELSTRGETGSDGGEILREMVCYGARITLEEGGVVAPYSITCGIAGWMMHTAFFSELEVALADYDRMRTELGRIVAGIPGRGASDEEIAEVCRQIEAFVDRFR